MMPFWTASLTAMVRQIALPPLMKADEETTSEPQVQDLSAGASQALWSRIGGTATLTKGKKRRLQRSLKELSGTYVVPPPKPVIPRAPRRVARPPVKPYSVLEVFTWTLAITMVATTQGWIGREPVALPRWDLRQASDSTDALQYVARAQPDLLVVAWPSTAWSPLQYYNHEMTAERLDVLRSRQQPDRDDCLSFVREVIKLQRLQGRACLGENPSRSHAWHEPYIQTAFDGEASGITHMCAFGLKHPESHLLLKKPTRLAGTGGRWWSVVRGAVRGAPNMFCFWALIGRTAPAKLRQWRSLRAAIPLPSPRR